MTIDLAIPCAMGDAIITRNQDGTRTVNRADPTIRVSMDFATSLATSDDPDLLDEHGTLQLDTAGDYLYRATGRWIDSDVQLYVRINGPDDDLAPGYQPHP